MNENHDAVNDNSAVDDEICELVLLQIKSLKEKPNQNAQSERKYTLHKETYNRVSHNPRHQRIGFVEIS